MVYTIGKASINWSSIMRKCAHVKKPSAWSLFIDYFPHESNLFQFIKIKMKMRKNSFQYLENFYEWMKEILSDKKHGITLYLCKLYFKDLDWLL